MAAEDDRHTEQAAVADFATAGEVDIVSAIDECCLEKARELAGSYRSLLRKREDLQAQAAEASGRYFTMEDVRYLLSMGAHNQDAERVQTSALSDPTQRAAINCEKVLSAMNRDVQRSIRKEILLPLWETEEQIEMFEIGVRSLTGLTRSVAEQLFMEGKCRYQITDPDGRYISRRTLKAEEEKAIYGIAVTLKNLLYEGGD